MFKKKTEGRVVGENLLRKKKMGGGAGKERGVTGQVARPGGGKGERERGAAAREEWAEGFGRPIPEGWGRFKPLPGLQGVGRDTGALTGSLGLTSPLQKWQKKRCAATAAPVPAADASAIFLFRPAVREGRRLPCLPLAAGCSRRSARASSMRPPLRARVSHVSARPTEAAWTQAPPPASQAPEGKSACTSPRPLAGPPNY